MTPLFPLWRPATDWTPQNDSLRGGSSTSRLEIPDGETGRAVFHGTLDSKTLGGAGFASVRTVGMRLWDWSGESGLEMVVLNCGGDEKEYTLVLKTDISGDGDDDDDGEPAAKETSTVSYEFNFTPASGTHSRQTIAAPFASFKPHYRGRPKQDAPPLDLAAVKRMSFMIRSFFGRPQQEGPFRLFIESVSAVKGDGGGRGGGALAGGGG